MEWVEGWRMVHKLPKVNQRYLKSKRAGLWGGPVPARSERRLFLEACLLQVSKLLLLLHLIKVGCLHKHIQHCLVMLLRTKSDVFVYLEAWYQYSKPYWHTVVVNSWLVVSNIFYFPFHIWDFHPSHSRTHIFQDGYCTTNQIGMNPYHTWLL